MISRLATASATLLAGSLLAAGAAAAATPPPATPKPVTKCSAAVTHRSVTERTCVTLAPAGAGSTTVTVKVRLSNATKKAVRVHAARVRYVSVVPKRGTLYENSPFSAAFTLAPGGATVLSNSTVLPSTWKDSALSDLAIKPTGKRVLIYQQSSGYVQPK